ncbi:unnamed protein product [Clavelina lepadiformis]|uniref:Uncharacterized protein n=1 Tax=Clavelina lepadiformis TaxID=159417 RepID=A0ABP0G5I6_CLALP
MLHLNLRLGEFFVGDQRIEPSPWPRVHQRDDCHEGVSQGQDEKKNDSGNSQFGIEILPPLHMFGGGYLAYAS